MDLDVHLIGSRVKQARLQRKMTQEQLAVHIGYSSTESVGHIECGRNKPSLRTLCRIADALDVSLDYLAGLTETPQSRVISEIAEEQSLSAEQTELLADIAQSMIPFVKRMTEK